MSQNGKLYQKLTPKQRKAISCLVDGGNFTRASLAAGVSTRTITRWRELPDFDAALKHAGTRKIADATRQITGGLETAIDFLLTIIDNEDAPYSVRTRAALGLIDRQIRLVEETDILERLEALENRL